MSNVTVKLWLKLQILCFLPIRSILCRQIFRASAFYCVGLRKASILLVACFVIWQLLRNVPWLLYVDFLVKQPVAVMPNAGRLLFANNCHVCAPNRGDIFFQVKGVPNKFCQENCHKQLVGSNDLLPVAPISGGYDTVAQIVQTYTLVALWHSINLDMEIQMVQHVAQVYILHIDVDMSCRVLQVDKRCWLDMMFEYFFEVSWTHQLFQNKLDRTKTPMPKCWILSSLQIWASLMFTGKRHASFKHLSSPFHVWYALAETTKLMFCWSMQLRELTFKMNISINRY